VGGYAPGQVLGSSFAASRGKRRYPNGCLTLRRRPGPVKNRKNTGAGDGVGPRPATHQPRPAKGQTAILIVFGGLRGEPVSLVINVRQILDQVVTAAREFLVETHLLRENIGDR